MSTSGQEGIADLWSLDITFTKLINGEHALEPSFEKPHAALENLHPRPRSLSVAEHGRKY